MDLLSPLEVVKNHCYIFKVVMVITLFGIFMLGVELLSSAFQGELSTKVIASLVTQLVVLSFMYYLYRVYYSMCMSSKRIERMHR